MNNLTGTEILELLKDISWDDLGYGEVDWKEFNSQGYNFGEVKEVAQYGGEGQGEKYYKVYYFIDHDVYIKIDGWYQSYCGAEFNDAPYEVKPIQKTITVFE